MQRLTYQILCLPNTSYYKEAYLKKSNYIIENIIDAHYEA